MLTQVELVGKVLTVDFGSGKTSYHVPGKIDTEEPKSRE